MQHNTAVCFLFHETQHLILKCLARNLDQVTATQVFSISLVSVLINNYNIVVQLTGSSTQHSFSSSFFPLILHDLT